MSFIYSLADTWNAVGTTFNSIQMDVSNGSGGAPVGAAASRIINLKNNGTSVFSVDVNGNISGFNVPTNTESAVAGTTAITNAYKGKTIGASGGFYTLSFTAIGNYDSDFQVKLTNKSSTRGKYISITGQPSNLFYPSTGDFILWPLQTVIIYSAGGTQFMIDGFSRWKLPFLAGGILNLYLDASLGSDLNDGLAAGAGNALRTIPFAVVTLVQSQLDIANAQVKINMANGTYVDALHLPGVFVGASGNAAVKLSGNLITPSSVLWSCTNEYCIQMFDNAILEIEGMKLVGLGGSAGGITMSSQSIIRLIQAIDFGACPSAHMSISQGSVIFVDASYSISGSATFHVIVSAGGQFLLGGGLTITLLANITVTIFAYAEWAIQSWSAVTFSLGAFAVTGQKYSCLGNAFINTSTADINWLPGSVPGSISLGGIYN